MAKLLVYILLLLAACTGFRKQQAIREDIVGECVYTGKYSPDSLKSTFPFNKAKDIQLVSFVNLQGDSTLDVVSSSIIKRFYSKHDDGTKSLDSSGIEILQWKESVFLNDKDRDELSNIFFNYADTTNPSTDITYACYNPRNAILFYDSSKTVYAGIEICFECRKALCHPYNLNYGSDCEGKMKMLQDFFIRKGIKYVEPD